MQSVYSTAPADWAKKKLELTKKKKKLKRKKEDLKDTETRPNNIDKTEQSKITKEMSTNQ